MDGKDRNEEGDGLPLSEKFGEVNDDTKIFQITHFPFKYRNMLHFSRRKKKIKKKLKEGENRKHPRNECKEKVGIKY